eukprot:Skav206019  [mRNA]  locus=scaffold4083:19185:22509:+ [translate_table: standard]
MNCEQCGIFEYAQSDFSESKRGTGKSFMAKAQLGPTGIKRHMRHSKSQLCFIRPAIWLYSRSAAGCWARFGPGGASRGMSLRCRGTFLEVEQLQGATDKLLHNAADTFAWRVEVSVSRGSYGHPEFCAAPCIRAFYSKCTAGFLCNFCHLEHSVSKVKLNKPDRQLLAFLGEAEALCVMLSSLRAKCSQLWGQQQDVMRLLLATIQRRITRLGGNPATQNGPSMLLLSQRLKRFSIGLLLDLFQYCQQVDATLKSELKTLVRSARAEMQSLG